MTEHLILEPTRTVHVHRREPSGAAITTAAFADLVCGDHELLRAEFDAIVTANFADSKDRTQRRRPPRAVATRTHRVASRGAAAPPSHRHDRASDADGRRPRARQRGPPVFRHDTPAGRQSDNHRADGTIAQTRRGGGQSTDAALARKTRGHAGSDRHGPPGKSTCHP